MKPKNFGMTGAWLSGGIEWCVVHHHRASTFLPVNYSLEGLFEGIDEMELWEKILRDKRAYEMIERLLPKEPELQKAA